MKLVDINRPHLKIKAEVHLRDWKDALIWLVLLGGVVGLIIWRIHD